MGSKNPPADPSIAAHLNRIPILAGCSIVQTNARGQTVWVNAGFEKLTGFTAQEAVGRTPGSLMQCEQTDPVTIVEIRAALAAAKPIRTSILNRSKSGQMCWLDLHIQPVFDEDGVLAGFQAIQTDITEIMEGRTRKRQALVLARAREADIRNVAELTGVGTWELNLADNQILWSEQAARILDLPSASPWRLGAGLALFEPSGRSQVRALVTAATADRAHFELEQPMTTPAGRRIWVHVIGRLVLTPGEPRRLLGALQDVTDKRAERETLRTALEATKIALSARTAYQEALDKYAIVAITDRRGDIVFVNDRFCEISGYEREELMGRNHRILNSGAHPRSFFKALWRAISAGRAWHGEICNRNKLGQLYWVDTTVVPLLGADGKPEQFVSVRYDITERKNADVERVTMVEALHERSLAAEAATIAKSQFLATISHELRTPMNGVIGMLDLLMATRLDSHQALRASTALESARGLLVLLNDILDFSKLESGQVSVETIAFSPRELLEHLDDLLSPRAEAKGLTLSCVVAPTVPAWLLGDPTRLSQILVNLIGNALKFTEHGQVEVEVTYEPEATGAELRLEVRDTGIGLSADEQALIFRRFVQADASTTRRFGGTGLGLAISKQLVELMGGDIGVSSEPGIGSRFWVKLGAAVAAAPDNIAVDPAAPIFDRALKILAADDHPVNRMVVRMYLEAAGHEVVLANDGAEALAALDKAPFDLIVMDIQMPVMDGLAATRSIRALPGPECDIPIIALTANAMAGDRERYLAQGMNAYVAKPIEPGVLLDAVARVTQDRLRR